MDGRDVKLHLRNQEHIERELKRIADALDKLVKAKEKEQQGLPVFTTETVTEIETTIDIEEENENERNN